MILGLDISSSVIGVTIMDSIGNLRLTDCIDLRTTTKKAQKLFPDIWSKIDFAVLYLQRLSEKYKISEIHIEEALSKFTPGKSSISTLSVLFKMNYILSYKMYEIFGIKPHYWNPIKVRSCNGLKIARGENAKERVLEYVCKLYPEFANSIPKNLPKINPWLDIADSILICRMGVLHGTSEANS